MTARILFMLLSGLLYLGLSAQRYEKPVFELDKFDLTARTNARIDENGRPCALIKVYVDDEITDVRGNVVGDVMDYGFEKQIFLTHDSKQVEICFRHHYPVRIVFNDYYYPSLTGSMTYIMEFMPDGIAQSSSGPQTVTQPEPPSRATVQTPSVPEPVPQANVDQIVKEIESAYNKKDYEKAYELAMSISDNPTAQYYLGLMFDYGRGVKQDYSEAKKWYRKAAEGGNASAMNALGFMYGNGLGVTRDYSEALKWFHKAIEGGNAEAMNNLGYMYAYGLGVKQNNEEALKWYRQGVEGGNAAAMNQLGLMYDEGLGVKQDYAEAVKWYRKAAEGGNASAMNNLGLMYHNGLGVKQDYAEALKWYRKGAEGGNATAMYNLGIMYEKGIGVNHDYAEALKWYRKAAENGHEDAKAKVKELEAKGVK